MQAGIVVYQRNGSTLAGKWTHQNVNGVAQQEVVHDVAPGAWEGDWPVEIFQNGTRIFEGRLSSVRLGEGLKLTWKDGANEFQGVGFIINDDMIAASLSRSLRRKPGPSWDGNDRD